MKDAVGRAWEVESGGGGIRAAHLKLATVAVNTASGSAASSPPAPTNAAANLPLNLEQAELLLIHRALAQAQGNVSKAAELLGINRAKIYRTLAQEESETTL